MAGEDDAGKCDSAKNCKYCQKTVVTSIAKCVNCDGLYHTSCALRVAGLVAVGRSNLVKCCVKEVEVMNEKTVSETVKKLIAAKNEIITSKNDIISELKAKEVLLFNNIKLLEEKIQDNNKNVHKNLDVGNIATSPRPVYYAASVTGAKLAETVAGPATRVPQLSKNQCHDQHNPKKQSVVTNENSAPVSLSQVNKAVLQAQQTSKMSEIQRLGALMTPEEIDPGWQQVKRRSRRFLVGRNEENDQVKAVPKFVSFHVSRLLPGTKPENLKSLLEHHFSEVTCEEHRSKHPEIYTSMKVTIKQEDLRNAWKKEVWPRGALVSRFFIRRRVLANQTDPQQED